MLAGRTWPLFALMAALVLCFGCSSSDRLTGAGPGDDAGKSLAQVLAEIEQAPVPAGVEAAVYEELRTELAAVLNARGVSKFASAPPTDDRSIFQPVFDSNTGALSWRYYSTGDYNQNGLVEVADLTPLGQNYNAMGPFPADSAMSVVDGNTDGAITVGDITPIGQNYGCMVTEYNVYGSDVQADYPATATAGNGGATLLDTVAFASAVNNPGERLLFDIIVTQQMDYYWIRPSDGSSEGVASDLVTASGGGPVEIPHSVIHDNLGTARVSGPILADGYPAIIYTETPDVGDTMLNFQRALDAEGADWDNPVQIDTQINGWNKASIAVIDGNPAVTYMKNGILYYVRATDAQGSTWGAPVIVEDGYNYVGESNVLREVNGRPAVAYVYSDGPDHVMAYKRADDAQGSAWTSPGSVLNTLPTGARINDISMEIVGGNPGIAYLFEDMDWGGTDYRGAIYDTANDVDGTSWGSGNLVHQVLSSEPGYMSSVQVLDLDGLPGVVTFMEVWPTETDSIGWLSTTPELIDGSFATPDVIFGPGHSSAEAGDILKNVTAFTVTIPEGTVAMVVPTVKDAAGEYKGTLWGAPVETGIALDWATAAVELQEFTEPKAVGSLALPLGKQASCYCSFSDAEILAMVAGATVQLMFMTSGYPEGQAYIMATWVYFALSAAMLGSLFSVG